MRESGGITFELARKAKRSKEKFDKLMMLSERYIIKFAMSSGIRDKSMSIDDVINEGRVICWKCVKKFDPSKNIKFTTFLVVCLKNHFGHNRAKQNRDKRSIQFNSTSLSTKLTQNLELGDLVIDKKSEHTFNNVENKLFLQQIMRNLNPNGYMLCRFMLRDLSFNEIAKKMKKSEMQIRHMFKKEVIEPSRNLIKFDNNNKLLDK